MRRAIYYALLAALWTGGMALVIWCLYLPWEPLFGFLIMSGGSLAAVATVAAAEEVREYLDRRAGRIFWQHTKFLPVPLPNAPIARESASSKPQIS